MAKKLNAEARVLEYVKNNPGKDALQIKAALGTRSNHLLKLERAGKIEYKPDARTDVWDWRVKEV